MLDFRLLVGRNLKAFTLEIRTNIYRICGLRFIEWSGVFYLCRAKHGFFYDAWT